MCARSAQNIIVRNVVLVINLQSREKRSITFLMKVVQRQFIEDEGSSETRVFLDFFSDDVFHWISADISNLYDSMLEVDFAYLEKVDNT